MANSIEVPVSLGLQAAQSQIETLRKMLQEGVQPDSRAFREITNMLERAITQAEHLRQTMGESFKTSSGSKKFQNDLQKTFDLIATVTGRLQGINSRDLILSADELQKVQDINKEMERLQNEITTIQAGKIGSFFDGDIKDEFKELQTVANGLSNNLSNMTFSGLSDKITKELDQANNKLDETKNKTQQLKNAQQSIGQIGSNDFLTGLIQKTRDATKLSAAAAKTVEDQLATAFSKYQELFDGKAFEIGTINTSSPTQVIMRNQFNAVSDAIEPEIQKINEDIQKYEEALARLRKIQTTGFKEGGAGAAASKASAAEIKAAAEAVGVQLRDRAKKSNGKSEDLDSYKTYAEQEIQKELDAIKDSKSKFEEAQRELENSISQIFDNIGQSVQIRDKSSFKTAIETWLKSSGVDTGAKEIQNALASIMKDSFTGDVFQNIGIGLNEYFTRALQEAGMEEGAAAAKAEELTRALSTLEGIITQENGKITVNQEKLDELRKNLENVYEAKEKAFSEKTGNITKPEEFLKANNALKQYVNGLANLESKQKALSNVQNAVTHWMGFYQVLNLGKRAIQDMKTHIQELDTVMTQIAVVTNMSQEDLWGQIGKYSQIARQYGVAIKGVYEVSQIYYQQGLNQGDVMNLTTETLKMARIAGLDYATAADYMTTAIRGFKLEMTDAAHVTDVYSALAAKTASSTEELAVAISKTASSAEAVGSSFEATSAMMATMISVTRESATNIGTALKSVISRYGEMTKDPSKLVDSEGEEMSLNRVDAALKTIGITIQDVNGQFRDFDDVILELGEKWNTLDKNSQRYIATLMAGNRQQSRFLSLVGNIDEYKNALEIAQNAEDAGELQTLKTLDSIDARIEKMKVTIQEFYTSSGLEKMYKGILDTITNIVSAANDMPKLFTNIPATAIAVGFQLINTIKNILKLIIATIQVGIENFKTNTNTALGNITVDSAKQGAEAGRAWRTNFEAEMNKLKSDNITGLKAISQTSLGKISGRFLSAAASAVGASLTIAGTNAYGASKTDNEDRAAGHLTLGGAIGNAISGGISGFMMSGGNPLITAVSAIASGLPSLVSGFNMLNVNLTRQIELSNKRVTEAKQTATEKKGQYNELNQAYVKLKQLKEASTESAEAMNEYKEYMNQLADSYPNLVSSIELTGDRTIELTALENALAGARLTNAKATKDAIEAEIEQQQLQIQARQNLLDLFSENNQGFNGVNLFNLINKYQEAQAYSLDTFIKENRIPSDGLDTELKKINAITEYINNIGLQLDYNLKELYTNGGLEGQTQVKYDLPLISKALSSGNYYEDYYLKRYSEAFNNNASGHLAGQVLGTIQNLSKQTGIAFEELAGIKEEDFTKLNAAEFANLLIKIREKAQQLVSAGQEELNKIYNTLTRAEVDIRVSERSTQELEKGKEDNVKALDKYTGFISSIAETIIPKDSYKIDEKTGKQDKDLIDAANVIIDNIIDYVLKDTSKVAELISDLGDYSTLTRSELNNILKKYEITEERTPKIYEGIIAQYQNYIQDINSELAKALIGTQFGNTQDKIDIIKLFGAGKISGEYKTLVLNSAKQYKELQKDGLTIAAQNLETNLLNLLNTVSSITDEDQAAQVSTILKSIDLTDYDSITKGIEQLQELPQGNEIFGSLINSLQIAANQITGNTAIWAQQLINSTKEFAESTEKFFGKFGKGMEYSEAFEAVQDIIKSSEKDYSFDELVDFDNELGGYVLNRTAIYESLEKLNKDRQKDIEKANDGLIKIQAAIELAKKITGIESEGKTPEEIVNKITTKEELPDGGQLLESIIKQWQDSGQELNEFLDNYNKEQSTKADFQIKEAEMALEKLGLKLAGSLDFSAIADGTASESTVKNMLAAAMKAKFPNAANGLINRWVDTIYSQLKEGNFKIFESVFGKGIVSDKTKTDVVEANLQQYHTAISEVLNATTNTLSQATQDLLKDNGYNQNITEVTEAVSIALQLYQKTTYETLEEANEQYAEILQKSLDTSGKDYQAIDFLSGAITIDSFKNLANNSGKKLETWFNIEGQDAQIAIEQAFDGALAYNKLTGEFDIVGSIDDFIGKVREITGAAIEANTIEYLELYESLLSSRNAKTIKQQQRIDRTAIREATKNITFTGKGQFASLDAIESLATALHLDVNSLIGNYIAELDAYSLKPDLTQLDLDKIDGVKEIIAESINAFIASLVELVSKGISGSLSQADVSNLKGNLGQLGLGELAENLDFTKTTEGLQLSQTSAIQLYNEIKKIDRLQGEVIFKELSQSLADSNERFKSSTGLLAYIKDLEKAIAEENQRINAADGKVSDARLNQYNAELAVAKEILAVRSTSEDSSFNFMSNDIPGGQKNPINYISNWSKALKTLQDASKEITKNGKGETGGGFISYQDWYNIANEMDSMAMKVGKQFDFAGITLGDGMNHAAELINKGIDALSINTSIGELEVSLGKMGVNFSDAADGLNSNVQDGIKGIAQAEIDMLDSMISVLETIVAMEQLGNIDTDNDMTIELPEILIEGQTGDTAQYTEVYETWRKNIISKLESQDKGYEDLQKAFKEVSINGKTLETIVKQDAKDFKEIDAQILSALYQASKSGNYNLDNIWQSVKETLAGIEGFEGQIDVGDMHLAISNGIVLEAKDGKYIVGGLEFDYSQYQEACRAAMLEKIGVKGEFTKVEGDSLGEVEYQGYLSVGSKQIKVQTEDKNVKYLSNITGQSYDSIDQLISAERDELIGLGKLSADTTALEYAYEVGYKVAPKITGVDTSNISQTQINNLVGKSLKDLQDAAKDTVTFEATFGFKFDSSMTEEQLAELKAKLGIENKPIEMTISANAPTGEGADVLAQLMAEPEPSRTITVNTEIGTDNAKILGKTTLDPIPVDTLDILVQTLQVILRSNPDMTEIDNVIQAIQNAGATPIEQLESLVKILAFVSGVTDLTALDNVVQAVKNGGAPSIEELQSFIELLSFISQKTDVSNLTGEVKNIEDNWSTDNPVSPLTSYVSALFIQLAAGALNTKDLDSEVNKVKAPDTPPLTSYAKELLIQLVNKLPNMDEVNEVVDKITQAENIPELISIAEQLLIKKGWTKPTEDEGLVPTGIVPSNSSIETLAVLVEALKYIANKTNGGKLNVDEKDIKVPDQLSGEYDVKALIAQALLDWENGENYDSSNIFPSGVIDIGTRRGTVKIDKVDVEWDKATKEQQIKYLEARQSYLTASIDQGRLALSNGDAESLARESGKAINIVKEEIRSQIEEARKELELIQQELQQLGINEFQFETELDTSNLEEQVEEAQEEAQKVASNKPAISLEGKVILASAGSSDVLGSPVVTSAQINENAKLSYDSDTTEEILTQDSIERSIEFDTNLEEVGKTILELAEKISSSITGAFSSFTPMNNLQGENPQQQGITAQPIDFSHLSDGLQPALEAMVKTINTTIESLSPKIKIDGEGSLAINKAKGVMQTINGMRPIIRVSSNTDEALRLVNAAIKIINSKTAKITVTTEYVDGDAGAAGKNNNGGTGGKPGKELPYNNKISDAKGNVALAKGRKTLLGELGPELYVTNGHYYIAGQNGAEFVDLPDDAIVFNHLQTQRLLKNGSAGRGKAVTNEKKATSLATGNAQGPAMASASAALAALKQIRAMWQSMLDASLSDLGQQAGGGSGGGGGKDKNTIDPGFIADLERWYNLLRQIDKLEKDISHEEQLRSKIQSDRIINGKAIYESQKRQLAMLDSEISKHMQLAQLQKSYYEVRRQDLAETNYGAIFTFNENGLMQYNDQAILGAGTEYETRGGLHALAKLNAQNPDGSSVYTAKQQYQMLKAWGFGNDLIYGNDGKEIQFQDDEGKDREEAYTEAVQAFWDKADGWKDELDSLYDSYNEQLDTIIEQETQRNELLQEIVDNQLAVEQEVLKAIEDREQKRIDDAQKERDALKESADKFIDGLNKSLNKERQLYQENQDAEELNSKRRQLAILQRSGGSATQIRSLQEQIRQAEKEAYFNSQQKQIDAIQEASDLEIERLDAQIDLMTETLAYQKEYGLLWNEVYQVMALDSAEIFEFIKGNNSEWWSKSELQTSEDSRNILGKLEAWEAYRNDDSNYRALITDNEYLSNQFNSVKEAINGSDSFDWTMFDSAMTELYGKEWEAIKPGIEGEFQSIIDGTGDVKTAIENTMKNSYFQDMLKKVDEAKGALEALSGAGSSSGTDSNSNGTSGGSSGGGSGEQSNSQSNKDKNGTVNVTYYTSGKILGQETYTKSPGVYSYSVFAKTFNGYILIGGTPASVQVTAGGATSMQIGYSSVKQNSNNNNNNNNNKNSVLKESEVSNPNESPSNPKNKAKYKVSVDSSTFNSEQEANNYIASQKKLIQGRLDTAINALKYNPLTPGLTEEKARLQNQLDKWNKATVKKIGGYELGGLNDYTGLAMLHGTKSKPEGILNAEQTRILREDILGGSNSLMSLLVDFKNSIGEIASPNDYKDINNSYSESPVNIEKVDVNMNVTSIATESQARAAGSAVRDEIMRVAKRSGINNNIRR